MIKLREQFYPHPLGRSTVGRVAELESLTAEKARGIMKDNFNLSQTIFSVAGKYDFEKLCRQLDGLFAGKRQGPARPLELGPRGGKYTHIDDQSAQVHIGLMTDSVTLTDEDYYNARVAVSVLSGGMSARLFTEVREKRGLCYAIGARYHALKDAAGIMCYAGTTPDKAQQTLDVITGEFNRLAEGISDRTDVVPHRGVEVNRVLRFRPSGNLVHVCIGSSEQRAFRRSGKNRDGVRPAERDAIGAFQGIDRDIHLRAGAGADALPYEEHGRLITFALSDDHFAVELDVGKALAHLLHGSLVRAVLVTLAQPL